MDSFHWVANRQITVKHGICREEGEYVPEADEWRDPELWERVEHIRRVPGPPPGFKPVVVEAAAEIPSSEPVLDEPPSIVEEIKPTEPESATVAPSSVPSAELEDAPERTEDGAVVLDAVQLMNDPEPPFEPNPEDLLDASADEFEPEEDEEEDEEDEPYTKSELARMLKSELQEIASDWELEVEDSTKTEIIAAILEAQEE